MSTGRLMLMFVAAGGWLVAALLAWFLISRLGFLGVGLIGVGTWFISTQLELEKEGAVGHELTPDLFAKQIEARRDMSRSDRAALRSEQSLMMQTARLFKYVGIGLAAIGLGGFLLYQL